MRCEYCGQHDYNYHDNIDYYHDNLVNDHNHNRARRYVYAGIRMQRQRPLLPQRGLHCIVPEHLRFRLLGRLVQRGAVFNNYHHNRSARINHDYNIVHDYNDRARERVRGPSVPGNLLATELVRL